MTKSPFPGMDPYLEQSWRDVHHKLCTYSCDDLQQQLGDALIARVDERLVVEVPVERRRRDLSPDVRVVERSFAPAGGPAPSGAGTALAEPLTVEVEFEAESHYEGFVEIVDPKSGTVVTVIEFLSMRNESSEGREEYQKKQWELRMGDVSLVEINLLRAGPNVTQVPFDRLPEHARTSYQAIVHRAWAGKKHEVYPIPLRSALPRIKVPLRQSDPDATLDLQSLIDRVYRNGAYHLEVDYARDAVPPLDEPDAGWAHALLKSAGKR
jgi:hypothetical protein